MDWFSTVVVVVIAIVGLIALAVFITCMLMLRGTAVRTKRRR